MAIPNCKHVVEQLAAQYPDEWKAAHPLGLAEESRLARERHEAARGVKTRGSARA